MASRPVRPSASEAIGTWIGLVRGEEGERRIAPIVHDSRQAILGIEQKRRLLDGGNVELLEYGILFIELYRVKG
jgi:hypothetical protein